MMFSHSAQAWSASGNRGATTGREGVGGTPSTTVNQLNANDGNWHMIALESSYTVGVSTNVSVSLDGGAISSFLVNSSAIPGTNGDIWFGGAPDTAQPTNEISYNAAQQYIAGEVCHVAYFTNALTGAQIAGLYSAAIPQPIIGRQPVSGLAGVGGGYTNSVGATGLQLAYQWFKDNAPLATQTNSALILNPVQTTDASTNYFVVVTNVYGAVTSSVVSLTVVTNVTFLAEYPITYENPMILYGGQIINGTNYLGSTPTFSISAVGAVPITYQWQTNGVAMGSATNTSLTITNCQQTSPSSFSCIVSNQYGAVTSMVWSVTYLPATTAPFPQTVLTAGPIGYWRLNEADDGQADGNDGLVCNDYQSGNNGMYTNMYLHNATFGTGYSPSTDPNEAAAEFGFFPTGSGINCDAFAINNVDLSVPAGGNGEFTVAVWANGFSTAQPNNAGLVTKGLFNGEEFTIDEGSTVSPSAVRFYVRDALATGYDASSSFSLASDSNWHFIVGVCDGANGGTTLYVDGVPKTGAVMPAAAGIINSSVIPLMIGARSANLASPGGNQFRGLLNDVAIYNYAMTPSQVARQFQSVVGPIAPYYIPPLPSTNASVAGGATLNLSAVAFGTPPLGFVWTNVTSGGTLLAAEFQPMVLPSMRH